MEDLSASFTIPINGIARGREKVVYIKLYVWEGIMNIDLLQSAAKIIEADGVDGLYKTAKLVGMPIALALLIANIRRDYRCGWPLGIGYDEMVEEKLKRHIPAVHNFLGQGECAFFYAGEWYCFDNFSAFAVYWRGRLWSTVEHAYQAAKFDDVDIVEKIWSATSAHQAKKIANSPQNRDLIRPNWKYVMRTIMKEILLAKLEQHEYVQIKLRKSQGMILVEDSHRDAYWGRGENWDGENWLGRIWMEIREERYPN